MKRSKGDMGRFLGWGGRTLTALALCALPGLAFAAFTVDRSAAMNISAVIEEGLVLTHISHVQPIRADFPVVLSLSVKSPKEPLLTASLLYRFSGDTNYTIVPLQPPPTGQVGSYFGSAEIPPNPTVGSSYQYYFEVTYGPATQIKTEAWRPVGGGTATVKTVIEMTKPVTATKDLTVSLSDGITPSGDSTVLVPVGTLPTSSSVSLGLMVSAEALAALDVPINGKWPISGLSFQVNPSAVFKHPVKFDFSYQDQDNNGREDTTGADEAVLQPAWFDGLNWRALSRTGIEKTKNLVTFNTSLTGYFALFPTNVLPVSQRPQEKIVTPNGDGINDAAFFDGLPGGARIDIFDVRGRVVREISDSPIWDGRDTSGEIVESGLYVYQVHSNEGLRSGTITIAR